jgi:cell division transport system permease protein
LSINNFVADTTTKFDEIQVFLLDDATDDQLDNIEEEVAKNKGVVSILYESKDQALETFKEEWGEDAYLLDGLEKDNPLPNSYVIKLEGIEFAENVVNSIKGLDGVEEVKYDKDVINKLVTFADYIRLGGIVLIAILVFVSVFIISNTIKLTVTSRRREINIMKYVGATNNYIRGPFIIEGVLLGLVGAVVSILIVYFGYEYFFGLVNEGLYSLFSVLLVTPKVIFTDIAIIFSAIGMGIGALGSIVSLKRFLNV